MKLKTFTVPIGLFQVIWMLTTCAFFFITQAEAGTNDCPYCDEYCSKFFNSGTGEGFRNCMEAQFKECCKKKHDKDWNDKVTNMQKEFEAAKKSQNDKSDQSDAELKKYKEMLDSLIKQALEERLKTERKTTEEPKKVEKEKHKKEKEENEKDELVLIIACSVSGVVLGALIVGFIVCCVVYYKKRKRIQQQQSEGAPAQGSVQPVRNQPQPVTEQPPYYLGQSTPGAVVYAYTPNPA